MTECKRKILVIVHPGSCCGSADENLGRYEARGLREYLTQTVTEWRGPVLVIDGCLSDELKWPSYEPLGRAIKNALRRAKSAQLPSKREWGCDDCGPGSSGAMEALLKAGLVTPDDHVVLTGAWATRGKEWGCVNGAANVLDAHSISNEFHDSAFYEIEDDEDEEEDEELEGA